MTSTSPPRRRPRPTLGLLLVAVLAGVAILEVWLLTAVSAQIGVLPTLAILIIEAVLGVWLMRREGDKAWKALQKAFESGQLPTGQLADAALILVGGILLVLPGFFTDIIGLLFLLPLTRPMARRLIGFVIAKQAAKSGVDLGVVRATFEPDTIIRGETVDDPGDPGPGSDPGPGRVISGEIEP